MVAQLCKGGAESFCHGISGMLHCKMPNAPPQVVPWLCEPRQVWDGTRSEFLFSVDPEKGVTLGPKMGWVLAEPKINNKVMKLGM